MCSPSCAKAAAAELNQRCSAALSHGGAQGSAAVATGPSQPKAPQQHPAAPQQQPGAPLSAYPPGGAQGDPASSQSMASSQHVDDVCFENLSNMVPLMGLWERFPLQSLEEAVKATGLQGLDACVHWAKAYFQGTPPHNLTVDQAGALRLYTMESPLYVEFNKAMRERDRAKAKPYFGLLQLMLTACHKMPKSTEPAIYRGTKDLPPQVLAEYAPGRTIVWGAFSSTTTNISVLSQPMFHGPSGNRTKFIITGCPCGVPVDHVSAIGNEAEVLLPPGLTFEVVGVLDSGAGLTEVQLKFKPQPYPLIELNPPAKFL
eukprot:CAMPEP_0175923780 /NCGR_PEP_ID=MMETSP0108-20121206/14753_1 /TAXON_ID=195067 ORGANISM="Goniomonas pacifica, Strain CCMP1869" /NCGR_SAMPLE_ID=MMETSP0108 /ASSEMBLY_ACC=CAM_ASM_000204 /LENGTH=315 /DNA_ID=CAMNT_0017246803 /DNA_START=1263 /DNA_END=2210 /DNA_ORIENTATION=+